MEGSENEEGSVSVWFLDVDLRLSIKKGKPYRRRYNINSFA